MDWVAWAGQPLFRDHVSTGRHASPEWRASLGVGVAVDNAAQPHSPGIPRAQEFHGMNKCIYSDNHFCSPTPSSFVLCSSSQSFFGIIFCKSTNKMGKVHGSLARAGKVKGQTPKVEKQEDVKKQPRGRAKKRMQYNRRYVNVVTGMGGKRVGPNSNADKMK